MELTILLFLLTEEGKENRFRFVLKTTNIQNILKKNQISSKINWSLLSHFMKHVNILRKKSNVVVDVDDDSIGGVTTK